MESELAAKREQIRELEELQDVAIRKLQKFIEDQEIMDEQYRELYHRNKRLEMKLRQRIDELDDTKKELHTVSTAFRDAHSLAAQISTHLKETREVVYDQQLDLEDWWAKEESLSRIIAQNKQSVISTRSKVLSEINECCAEISKFISTSADDCEVLNRNIERGLAELKECLNNCNKNTKSADECLFRWNSESEEMCRAFVTKIVTLCSNSQAVENNLTTEAETSCSTSVKVLQKLSSVKSEVLKMSQTAEQSTKEAQSLKTHKMIELAKAIVAECESYNDENEETLNMMKSHDVATFENVHESTCVADNVLEGVSKMITDRMSSAEVLRDACSTLSDMCKNIEKEAGSLADAVINTTRSNTDFIRDSLTSNEDSGEKIGIISDDIEEKRVKSQNDQLKHEQAIVQHVRDRLGEINRGLTFLVEEHWLSPRRRGKHQRSRIMRLLRTRIFRSFQKKRICFL
ncbi:Mitogen-activated protein kinase 7 [Parelaphostrongylus tenuis]|uniref:Mitogen-activated protein kinase 7 n=1 Tax=Parelaphostrongylus tenuis TaxID=148309 RepID=A0AAD5QET4_PARTN|nr:Mitogen-activated protein kinase 7 [Parelaphostrongylus tenuis]